jgi:hypothetical protein
MGSQTKSAGTAADLGAGWSDVSFMTGAPDGGTGFSTMDDATTVRFTNFGFDIPGTPTITEVNVTLYGRTNHITAVNAAVDLTSGQACGGMFFNNQAGVTGSTGTASGNPSIATMEGSTWGVEISNALGPGASSLEIDAVEIEVVWASGFSFGAVVG